LEQKLELTLAALGQKKSEYERSTAKHSEHPSLPEYQNKYRKKLEKDVAVLEKKLVEAKADHEKANAMLAVTLTRHMPLEIENMIHQLMDKNLQKQTAALEAKAAACEMSPEMEKKLENLVNQQVQKQTAALEAEVTALKSKVTTLERRPVSTSTSTVSHDEAASLKNQFKQLNDSLKQKTYDRTREDARQQDLIDKLSTRTRALEDQVAKLQKENTAAQPNPTVPVDADLKSRVDKLESTLTADREYHIEQNKTLNKELAAVSVETDKTASRVNRLSDDVVYREEFAALQSRFTKLKVDTDELTVDVSQAKTDSANMKTNLDECSKTVTHHRGILSRLDIEVLEKVADSYQFEWDGMQKAASTVAELQERVSQIEQTRQGICQGCAEIKQLVTESMKQNTPDPATIERLVKDSVSRNTPDPVTITHTTPRDVSPQPSLALVQAQLAKIVDKVNRLEGLVNKHDGGFKHLGAKIQLMIADAKAELKGDFQRDLQRVETRLNELPATTTTPEFPLSAAEVDLFRTKVEKFEGDFEKLSTNVQVLDQKIGRVDYIDHQVLALEAQCNNISTKNLIDSVVLQMKKLYPDNARIFSNLKELYDRSVKADEELKTIQQEVKRLWTFVRALQAHAPQSPLPQNPPTGGNKRRRTEEASDDNSRPAPNGIGPGTRRM
jgi:chromosome segregation ATPase